MSGRRQRFRPPPANDPRIAQCLRCGYRWYPDPRRGRPVRCPGLPCGSPYWDRPYERGRPAHKRPAAGASA